MSVESKIKQLLERVDAKSSLEEADAMVPTKGKDTSIKAANGGDASQPKLGSSEDASYEERDEAEENQGAVAAKGINQNTIKMKGPVGATPNFQTVGDATSAVGQASSAGNVPVGEEEEVDGEVIAEDEVQAPAAIDLSPIFGDDLSEDFKAKATSIFEAAVIARVNSEMDKVAASLEEKYAADVAEYKDGIVEKIDSYLNYVVENWMKENELALENGLRTEIAEDFMTGLKVLFKEHYIEVPEEKYDVIGELQAKAAELEAKLDEAIGNNVDLNKEVTSLKRQAVVEELSKDLADTEAAKLGKLLEGVDFENEDLYREKVSVIKDNYFPKNAVTESVSQSVQAQQTLTEETDVPTEFTDGSSVVSTYAKALSRSIKRA
jgi:phage host-nuclease inhibitor protein Gam